MKRIIRLTESDLTRIVRRVIMEQAGDAEISQALDGLKTVLTTMMDYIVQKYPNLSKNATDAKTYLDSYIELAKKMQLQANDQTAKTAFVKMYKILTLGGKGGYQPFESLRRIFKDLHKLDTESGYLNQSYDVNQKQNIIKLIEGISEDLKRLRMS
jgi:hypothetical protein